MVKNLIIVALAALVIGLTSFPVNERTWADGLHRGVHLGYWVGYLRGSRHLNPREAY